MAEQKNGRCISHKLDEFKDAPENELVENCMGVIRTYAVTLKKRYNLQHELEDLVQEGCTGLIKAQRTYANNKNAKFSTYAARCINGEILTFVHTKNYLVRVPERKVKSIHLQFIPIEQFACIGEDADGKNNNVISDSQYIQQPLQNGNKKEIIDKILSQLQVEEIFKILQKHARYKARYNLGKRKLILCLRHGVCGEREYEFKEIGKILGLTKQRAYQLYQETIKDIKNLCN